MMSQGKIKEICLSSKVSVLLDGPKSALNQVILRVFCEILPPHQFFS